MCLTSCMKQPKYKKLSPKKEAQLLTEQERIGKAINKRRICLNPFFKYEVTK